MKKFDILSIQKERETRATMPLPTTTSYTALFAQKELVRMYTTQMKREKDQRLATIRALVEVYTISFTHVNPFLLRWFIACFYSFRVTS